jgi:hypothetical protein
MRIPRQSGPLCNIISEPTYYLLLEQPKMATVLVDALSAFQETLKERSQQRWPLKWAQTEINLAAALQLRAGLNNSLSDAQASIETLSRTREFLLSKGMDVSLVENSLSISRALACRHGQANH